MNEPPDISQSKPPPTPRQLGDAVGQPPPPSGEPLGAAPGPVPAQPPIARRVKWGPSEAMLGILSVLGMVIAGGLLIYPITGTDGIDATLGSQVVLEIALVATALLFASRGGETAPFAALGLRRPRPGWFKTAALGYGVYFVAVIAIVALVGNPEQTDVADQLGFDESTIAAIAAAVLIVFIVPVCEELFFRGFFFAGMRSKLPFWAAALISALLFGAVHLSEANLVAGLQLTLLGLVLATVYERTDSLWANIAIHAFNNGLAFIFLVAG